MQFGHQRLHLLGLLEQFLGVRGREQGHWLCDGEVVAQIFRIQKRFALRVLHELVRILPIDEDTA